MAAIMDEWGRVAHQVRKLGKSLGIDHPKELDKLQGDLFKRQSSRLAALAGFLQQVNDTVKTQQAEAQANFEAANAFDEEGQTASGKLELEFHAEGGEVNIPLEELEAAIQAANNKGEAQEKPKPKRSPKKS